MVTIGEDGVYYITCSSELQLEIVLKDLAEEFCGGIGYYNILINKIR
jgi:hypothetical protein